MSLEWKFVLLLISAVPQYDKRNFSRSHNIVWTEKFIRNRNQVMLLVNPSAYLWRPRTYAWSGRADSRHSTTQRRKRYCASIESAAIVTRLWFAQVHKMRSSCTQVASCSQLKLNRSIITFFIQQFFNQNVSKRESVAQCSSRNMSSDELSYRRKGYWPQALPPEHETTNIIEHVNLNIYHGLFTKTALGFV